MGFTKMKSPRRIALMGMAMAGALGIYFFGANTSVPEGLEGVAVNSVPLSQVELVRHDGKALSRSDFEGKWTFVFFGFTNCPDVCPSTLMQLAQANPLLKQATTEPQQVLFVSVDPKRDSPNRIQQYVKYFDENFVGATGTAEAIERFESIFSARHRIDGADGTNYEVVHSSAIYIIDPAAHWVGKWQPPLDPKNIQTQLRALSQFIRQQGAQT